LLNVAGNLDRQRETGEDGIPANGISASAANFAMSFKTSIALAITANASPQAVTPGAMSGTINGVPWSIQQGSTLSIDTGANQEYVYVTSVTSTTFSAVFGKSHGTNSKVGGFVYNQERDAAGEADGAAGIGTAVAAEYEFNGGGPGGGSFDRARNLQGKGKTSQTISAGGTQGSLSLTIGANTGLKAGMQVMLATASFPTSGSYEAVYVDLSYVEGTNTVPLLSAIQLANTYTTVYYDAFSADGPGLSGFLPIGVGIEEEALYDPVTGLYFVERAATTRPLQWRDDRPPARRPRHHRRGGRQLGRHQGDLSRLRRWPHSGRRLHRLHHHHRLWLEDGPLEIDPAVGHCHHRWRHSRPAHPALGGEHGRRQQRCHRGEARYQRWCRLRRRRGLFGQPHRPGHRRWRHGHRSPVLEPEHGRAAARRARLRDQAGQGGDPARHHRHHRHQFRRQHHPQRRRRRLRNRVGRGQFLTAW
jgi:hypothetical protein